MNAFVRLAGTFKYHIGKVLLDLLEDFVIYCVWKVKRLHFVCTTKGGKFDSSIIGDQGIKRQRFLRAFMKGTPQNTGFFLGK